MKTPQELYSYYVANVRRVDYALHQIALTVRSAIGENNEKAISSFLPLYMLLLGAWAEGRLKKLLFEPGAFSDAERAHINSTKVHIDKWHRVLTTAFEKHYLIASADLAHRLPEPAKTRFNEVKNLLDSELRIIIEVRNRLAHGQWEFILNSPQNDISSRLAPVVKNENLLSLQFKQKLLGSLLDTVNDLAVSKPTFERDFDLHFGHITQTRTNLKNRTYSDYVNTLLWKRKKGLLRRNKV